MSAKIIEKTITRKIETLPGAILFIERLAIKMSANKFIPQNKRKVFVTYCVLASEALRFWYEWLAELERFR